jgi:mycothiol synthase
VNAPAGFTVRPGTLEDAAAAAELMNAFDRAYLEEPDTVDAAEVSGWWARIELDRDSRFYFDAEGRLAGTAALYSRNEGRLDLDAYVLPEQAGNGLGGAMVDWLEEETTRRGVEHARTSAITADRAAARLLGARGYEPVRHFYRMSIELDAPPPEPEWPEGFAVSTLQPGEDELLHTVTEETFAEHWGHEHRPFDEWRKHNVDREWWDPSLVYLVREGTEVVAAEMGAIRFGCGWVNTVGTRKPWRGKGLGRGLLLQAFGELYRRGERRIALAVDAGNETGATHLYESVGMRIAWQADVYEKHM